MVSRCLHSLAVVHFLRLARRERAQERIVKQEFAEVVQFTPLERGPDCFVKQWRLSQCLRA